METTFDTTAWVMQSLLIMFAALLVIPLIRAILGLALISISAGLGFENSSLREAGVSLLPAFLKTALGFATVVALAQPQMASAAETPHLIIDRIVTSPTPQPVSVAPSPPPQQPTAPATQPRVIVFDDDEMLSEPLEPEAGVYVVKVGDSLWTIARGLISDPNPSARTIDRTWRALWEANRAAIGADPSLIRPGTRLRLDLPQVAHEQ